MKRGGMRKPFLDLNLSSGGAQCRCDTATARDRLRSLVGVFFFVWIFFAFFFFWGGGEGLINQILAIYLEPILNRNLNNCSGPQVIYLIVTKKTLFTDSEHLKDFTSEVLTSNSNMGTSEVRGGWGGGGRVVW